jgi:hypothetical protein
MNIMPTAITIMCLASGCGSKSSIQRDSTSCEETGRVTVPANPETGAPSRCVSGATQEQICHLKDMKHDQVTNDCVPVTAADMRMLYLHESYSALSRLDQQFISICVGGDAWAAMPGDQRDDVTNKLLHATTAWLEPLREVGLSEFESRLSLVETSAGCPVDALTKVEIVSETPICSHRRGCVVPDQSTMYLRVGDGLDEAVILHEFGHTFGLADLYIDTVFRPEDPPDSVTGCVKGFFGSTMCHNRTELGPADIAGIRNMYCTVSDSATCPAPASWSHAFFGSLLATCNSDDSFFTLSYDRSLALSGVPYGGFYKEIDQEQINVTGSDIDGNFAALSMVSEDGSRTLKWNIDAATLDGQAVTCDPIAPWLLKL